MDVIVRPFRARGSFESATQQLAVEIQLWLGKLDEEYEESITYSHSMSETTHYCSAIVCLRKKTVRESKDPAWEPKKTGQEGRGLIGRLGLGGESPES